MAWQSELGRRCRAAIGYGRHYCSGPWLTSSSHRNLASPRWIVWHVVSCVFLDALGCISCRHQYSEHHEPLLFSRPCTLEAAPGDEHLSAMVRILAAGTDLVSLKQACASPHYGALASLGVTEDGFSLGWLKSMTAAIGGGCSRFLNSPSTVAEAKVSHGTVRVVTLPVQPRRRGEASL